MLKIAFLFPGQGSQYPGMGHDLFENFACARAIFDEADRVLNFSISKLCFGGPAADLQLTANTQPGILAASLAAAAALEEQGVRPSHATGHSLGEYSAYVVAGALRADDALRLVRKRGEYMQQAVPVGQGAMAALLGGTPAAVKAICQEAAQGQICAPANLNSPSQIVIAGDTAAVTRAVGLASKYGVRRAVMLDVSAPFHCALMRPAADHLARDLDAAEIRNPRVPVVKNVDAQFATESDQVRAGLKQQVTSPVLWEASMRKLLASGVNLMIEVGPGKVLSGLMRQVDRTVECLHVEDANSLNEAVERVRASER